MDLPLYTTVSWSELSDLGSVNYHQFNYAITLDQVMRQAGENEAQKLFRGILLRLRNGELSVADWKQLMKQTLTEIDDLRQMLLSSIKFQRVRLTVKSHPHSQFCVSSFTATCICYSKLAKMCGPG